MGVTRLMAGAAPFFYPGNAIGCVVLHGFTGSPQEVRWLGQYLNKQGYTVIGPRLAGHGTQPADMHGVRWQEWYSDALAAYELLCERCETIFVVGLSMGAALSMLLAADVEVGGVAGLATPYAIYRTWRRPILKVAALLGMSMGKDQPPDGDRLDRAVRDEQAARGEPVTGRASYPYYPAEAVDELWSLLDAARGALPRITAPALLIQSELDNVVPLEQVEQIYAALGSVDKRKLILHEGRHVITEDVAREVAFKAVGEFIAEQLADGH